MHPHQSSQVVSHGPMSPVEFETLGLKALSQSSLVTQTCNSSYSGG